MFRELNDAGVAGASIDDAYEFVMEIARSDDELPEIADRLRQLGS